MRRLASVTLSGGGPAISHTYDRLGRPLVTTTGSYARPTRTYRADTLAEATQLIEYDTDGDATFDLARTLTRSYDAAMLSRSTGYTLGPGTSAVYGYEGAAGRLASVTGGGLSFAYAYHPARPHLLASVSTPSLTVTNTWEPNRDVLAVKTNAGFSSYNYAINALDQRTGGGGDRQFK